MVYSLKGTVSRVYRHFFKSKNSSCAPYEQAKSVLRKFSFSRRYARKVCCWLCWHGVSVVIDYVDTVSAYIVVDYTDTKTTLVWRIMQYCRSVPGFHWAMHFFFKVEVWIRHSAETLCCGLWDYVKYEYIPVLSLCSGGGGVWLLSAREIHMYILYILYYILYILANKLSLARKDMGRWLSALNMHGPGDLHKY